MCRSAMVAEASQKGKELTCKEVKKAMNVLCCTQYIDNDSKDEEEVV